MRKYSKKELIPLETLTQEVPLRAPTVLPLVAEDAPAQDVGTAATSAAWAAGQKELNPDNLVVAWERLQVRILLILGSQLGFILGGIFLQMPQIKPAPKGVDGSRLEAYLSEDEFTSKFKMTPAEFYKHPKWKQITIRKGVGIF